LNRSEFIYVLENPADTASATIGEIDGLIGIFPYFQGAYMLLLKCLKEKDDAAFEGRLRQNAMFVADREVLYHYLENGLWETAEKETLTINGKIELVGTAIAEETETTVSENGPTSVEVADIIDLDTFTPKTSDNRHNLGNDLLLLETEPPQPTQKELIDRFIAVEPRITPNRDKRETQQPDIAQPFTERTDGLVSETLAKIYIKQKYYFRAIEIYEKLSLKYPEKNSYFAIQIQKVKEQIN